MSLKAESSDASGKFTGENLKLDTHSKSEGSETCLFLLENENELREKKTKHFRISYKKDVLFLGKSLKVETDWSAQFEIYRMDMLLNSYENKRKKIFIKKLQSK